ncbi:uncharacterized protein EDB91DRAFT_212374 [Suillus paluster]|uniref:uncharacterized protein n=1 Tax=Suillus paluster TaxID=48578 RepID=UPI001B883D49|nr:uncharacterized protein EDB91DRAFT_212374 [Suillus paluster]KAG1744148.1 hypothetical protein EDB91DRAFT_212374 [Suillus paluster]
MTLVSDDPSWWPVINGNLLTSYIVVSASVGVMYDWALTFGQEVELVWRQRWSLMTVLYLSVRYGGIIYAALRILANVPTISVTDAVSYVMFVVANSMAAAVDAMLCVIMITRLYAMYQQSRKVLIFLVVIFLALTIAAIALGTIPMTDGSGEELILSGTYWCNVQLVGNSNILECIGWMLVVVWEVLAVCLAVWIAVKHFRELRRYSAAGIIEDFLAMLLKTHVVYFASCLVVSCISIGHLSSTISKVRRLVADLCMRVRFIVPTERKFPRGSRLWCL